MIKDVTGSLPKCSGGNTELTKTSLRDQATLTFTRLAVKTKRSRRRSINSYLPHSWSTSTRAKPWQAQEVEGQWFRKHPQSNLLGTGTLCPEQLREPAKFCRAAFRAPLQSEACRRNQGHAIQESQGGGVDSSRNVGFVWKGRKTSELPWVSRDTSFRHIRQ